MIRIATEKDINNISKTYTELLEYEKTNVSNSNWKLGLYPTEKTAENGIKEKSLFILEENNEICASMILNHQQAEEYKNIQWTVEADKNEVLVIHTLCVPPSKSGHGYGKKMVYFAIEFAKKNKIKTIRIDTWHKNFPAQSLYKKCGFKLLGEQHVMHMGLIDETLVYLDKDLQENSDQRPSFHFSTPIGWCNDPNGFSQFGGKAHLFFQYHPYSTQWGPMHWGHVTSKDLLTWQIEPIALFPDSDADYKGCFSGTAIEKDGNHILVYTGVTNNGNVDIQNQCIATGDGITYKKRSDNPILTAKDIPFEYNIEHFRDPKIWKKDDIFYLACVIKQKNDNGAMILFESKDTENWIYKGIIDSSKDGLSKMWECPDVSVIDNKDILIFSPQEVKENTNLGFHNGNNSVYISGHFDYTNYKFHRELRPENGYTAAQIDYGIDFYAPETTKLSDNRTIMIAWMQAWESYITPENYNWSGMMTIPRELHFKNNRLYQLPVRELENWKTNKISDEIHTNKTETIFSNQKRHFEINLHIDNISIKTGGFIKLILGTANENVYLELNLSDWNIYFDRTKSLTPGTIPTRKEKLRLESDADQTSNINVRILCDTCSMEVFINDGIMAFTNTFFFDASKSDFVIENHTSERIKYDYWKIEKPLENRI